MFYTTTSICANTNPENLVFRLCITKLTAISDNIVVMCTEMIHHTFSKCAISKHQKCAA